MEMDLKHIIDKIKTEGVNKAEEKAAEIITQAEKRASKTEEEARVQAQDITRQAEKTAEKLRKQGEEALNQAARDVLLGLKEDITLLFDKLMKRQIREELSPEVITDIILKLAENLRKEGGEKIEVLVNEEDLGKLETVLFAKVKEDASGLKQNWSWQPGCKGNCCLWSRPLLLGLKLPPGV